jgi:hypothetical protein
MWTGILAYYVFIPTYLAYVLHISKSVKSIVTDVATVY